MFWQNQVKRMKRSRKFWKNGIRKGKGFRRGKTAGFFRILSRNRDWDWRCICQKTGSENEERNIFLFFVLLFIACLILSCFVMLVITKRLSRPIVALSNAARQISEGKLDVHLQAEMGDEIGDADGEL